MLYMVFFDDQSGENGFNRLIGDRVSDPEA